MTTDKQDSNHATSNILTRYAPYVVSLMTGFAAAFVSLEVGNGDNENKAYATTVAQVEKLTNLVNQMQDKIAALQAQIASRDLQIVELKAQFNKTQDANRLLQMYLDSIPFPMWIKVLRPNGDLEMFMINNAYVYEFGKTKREYVGRTDFDVWPTNLAEQYYENDMKVLDTNGFVKTEELVYTTRHSGGVMMLIWKFKVDTLDGRRGVGGFVIDRGEIK